MSLILEKASGNCVVKKLRASLLLKTYFNALRKINFDGRMLHFLEVLSATPQETIDIMRSQAAAHVALSKTLIADVSDTTKSSAAATCNDSTNFYVSHNLATYQLNL